MGAPSKNSNALRHGLSAGKLPDGCRYIRRLTDRFRISLEAEVRDIKGEITLADAAAINSAVRWERHAMLSLRWLRTEPDLTPDQRLSFSREIARASSERDKCIRSLELDKHRADAIASLYSPAALLPAQDAQAPPQLAGRSADESPAPPANEAPAAAPGDVSLM